MQWRHHHLGLVELLLYFEERWASTYISDFTEQVSKRDLAARIIIALLSE